MAGKQQQAAGSFMDLDFYSGGSAFFVPDGDYCCFFEVQYLEPEKKDGTKTGQKLVGVMMTAHSLTDPEKRGDGAYTRFYSMGQEAGKSWAPDPDTGKGIVPLANGEGKPLPKMTNWNLFLLSLYDSGMPKGAIQDVGGLDGGHYHLENQPEPAERKAFRTTAATGDAEQAQPQRNNNNNTVAVVTDILAAPWNGEGGMPEEAATKPNGKVKGAASKPVQVAPKTAPKTAAKAAVSGEPDAADVEVAAQNAVSNVLGKYPNGCTKLVLKTQVFPALKKSDGDVMAQAVVSTFFGDDETLSGLLEGLRHKLDGSKVVPMSEDE